MNQSKAILIIQRWYKNKIKDRQENIKTINKEFDIIYNLIYSMMNRVNESFNNGIISQNKYNSNMIEIDNILDYYKDFPKPITIDSYNNIDKKQIYENINKIKKNIVDLSKTCGLQSINDIVFLITGKNILSLMKNTIYDKLFYFFNNTFVPISSDLYILEDKEYIHKNNENDTLKNLDNDNAKDSTNQLIAFVKQTIDSTVQENSILYDKGILDKIKLPTAKKLNFKPNSLLESIQGSRVYIPIENCKKIIVMNGYFKEDPLNLSRIGGSLGEKNTDIINSLSKIVNLPNNYKYAYVDQMTLRDFIVYDNNEIIKNCNLAFNGLKRLKSKTISSLVKEFLVSDIEKQRHILTLFLLTDNDTDTQYLAYLMYDMISNEQYLLKPQPLAEQVYNSLHWSVQKLFKIAIKKVNKYTQKLIDFNENDIPYEKRICLMKANDSVKSKAMEKYKEINSKSGDGASKAQQYLDAILKIPFGIYKKEKILTLLNEFIDKFKGHIENSFISIKKINPNSDINKFLVKLNDLFCNFSQKDLKSITIDSFINSYENIIKEMEKENLNCKDDLENNLNKKTVKELKEELKNLNLSTKGKKNDLIKTYLEFEKENSKQQNDLLLYPSFKNLHLQQNELVNEWNSYKYEKKTYIESVHSILTKAVHGHDEAKQQVERIIGQWINGEMNGYCFGFEGPPGTGKTSFAKKGLTQCLKDEDGNPRPFSFIALGGSSNGATLEGHSYTYVGSTWGRIVDILMESKCMNPIIFIDELDKVSKTEHGKEIIGILTHMTDSTQNDEFSDKYFSGIKIDLSKALIIFSYNDVDKIDPILLDRIHRIQFSNLSLHDKINVANCHLLPEIYKTVGLDDTCIKIDNESLKYIIETYTWEAGARKLKEKLFEIIRDINLRYLTQEKMDYPIIVDKNYIEDIFSDKPKVQIKKIAKQPRIGLVNGLYATVSGVGGLTIIETYKTPTENALSLILTGQQGDVMQESVKCAKTIAWNLLPLDYQKKLKEDWKDSGSFGLHIHCPEASTPKDGPSAGGAMTLCILSVLAKIPVKNTIAMTGEIDLNGSIHAIGGLDSKIEGAKRAGANLVLCPKQNEDALKKIRESDHPPENDNFKVVMVESIWEIIDLALVDNDFKFNKYF